MSVLSNRLKRLKVPVGERIWEPVGGFRDKLKLGYRKGARGGASWLGKARIDGVLHQGRLGEADDVPGTGLTYTDAIGAIGRWHAALALRLAEQQVIETSEAEAARHAAASVRGYITSYLTHRAAAKGAVSAADARERFRAHVLDTPLADKTVAALTMDDLRTWRAGLRNITRKGLAHAEPMGAATEKRLMSDLKAALGHELPPAARRAMKPRAGAGNGARPLPYWDPPTIAQVIAAARTVDPDLGALVLVLASTGARFSQVRRIRVCDVLVDTGVILVPRSHKGTSTTKSQSFVRVPLQGDVIDALKPVMAGRPGHEPLLQRWVYRHVRQAPGLLTWVKDHRAPWSQATTMLDNWRATVAAVGLAYAPPYTLRHSSIIRWLRSGLSGETVADLHDTSVDMLRQTYASDLSSKSEDLLRERLKTMEGLVSTASAAPV